MTPTAAPGHHGGLHAQPRSGRSHRCVFSPRMPVNGFMVPDVAISAKTCAPTAEGCAPPLKLPESCRGTSRRPTVDRESARCLAGDGPGARRAQPAKTREAARAGDGSFEVDTADSTSRLPPIEVDCGLLARHSPDPSVQPASYRPVSNTVTGAWRGSRTPSMSAPGGPGRSLITKRFATTAARTMSLRRLRALSRAMALFHHSQAAR